MTNIKPFLVKIKYVSSTSEVFRLPTDAMVSTIIEALERLNISKNDAEILAKYLIEDDAIITMTKKLEEVIKENFEWWYSKDEDEYGDED